MQHKEPCKKILEIATQLGPNYTVRTIDNENVIYREINGYEFEVSGLDSNAAKIDASLYIWERTVASFIVEDIHDIHSVSRLADLLTEKEYVYSARPHTLPDQKPLRR